MPEGLGVEVTAVVGVTVCPILAMEELFAETGDREHALPGGGVGWAGEDHSVVEENCFDGRH